MIAAKCFKDANVEGGNMFAPAEATTPGSQLARESSDAIKVVLDFQHRDWSFVSQPGLYPTSCGNGTSTDNPRGAPSDRNEHLRQCPEVYRERLYSSHTASTRRWSP